MRTFLHNSPCQQQRGIVAVEFALISLVYFFVIFGIMELGRMLYVWNTVQEVTRRAAREAVVRDFTSEIGAVQREAIFRPGSSGSASLPAAPEITNADIRITFLNGNLVSASPMPSDPADNISACNDADRTSSCIRFVEACVGTGGACTGFIKYAPMIGLFPALAIDIPASSVIMPAESLGYSPSP